MMIERVVMAAVEQLCAHADVTVELLDALEYPLGETLSAVAELGVAGVDVEVDDGRLILAIRLRTILHEPLTALGESADLVTAFFEVGALDGSAGLSLAGTLG